MKKIGTYLTILLVSISCTDDNLSELNIDSKKANTVTAESLLTGAQKNLFDAMTSSTVFELWSQHWTQTTYTNESNYFIAGADPSAEFWENIYNDVLTNLKTAREIVGEDAGLSDGEKQNKQAIMTILEVYAYQVLVDMNGDIPFTEALDPDNTAPVYDDDGFIYGELLKNLSSAIETIDETANSFGDEDVIYGGDLVQWKKFANSLKLRFGMRLSDVDSQTAQKAVQEAIDGGVMDSNADNFTIKYENAPPNNNPRHNLFVIEERNIDYVPGKTLVDEMNALNDPRRSVFFEDNNDDPDTPGPEFDGGTIGASNTYGSFSHISTQIVENPTFPGTLMDYAQIEFLLAEAAERSFVGSPSDAEGHYNAAIKASFVFWGLAPGDADLYLSAPEVNYATATGTWQEKIGTQKWIALFSNGFEAWTEYRRLDEPELTLSSKSEAEVPKRVVYPTTESALNTENYNSAASKMGGDTLERPIFWDVE